MASLKLQRWAKFSGRPGPVIVVVMDGIGIGKPDETNAVHVARTPTLDAAMRQYQTTRLVAHGPAVGLPDWGDMGNSEVGHNAIGAGRVFDQGAKLVNKAIATGAIFTTPLWGRIAERCRAGGATLHLIGLLSDGNVHSHIDHLFAIIRKSAEMGFPRLRVHPLLDGRDVGETSALEYVEPLERLLAEICSAGGLDYRIASGGGRMVTTMDRYEADWNIVKRGWEAHVLGEAPLKFRSASEAIRTIREKEPGITDQYLPPFVIVDTSGNPVGPIQDGDVVVLFNFRGDRAIEISRAFEEKDFAYFDRRRHPDVLFAGMMEYDGDLKIPTHYLVNPPAIDRTMGEYLVANNVMQFALSETQKFGHVTYFWNGNRSGYFDERLETYVEIPSDRVPFDQRPWMKAAEITDETIALMESGRYRFGRINYANGDMVGHTGHFEAAVIAVEAVDHCLERLLRSVEHLRGIALITADHGNADQMFTIENGRRVVRTAHTLNPVPFIVFDPGYKGEYRLRKDLERPGISHIAATALNLLGWEAPEDYDPSLIE
jgi:2,3-bisphosphoglycerate-independent phosphoglycerate mutase